MQADSFLVALAEGALVVIPLALSLTVQQFAQGLAAHWLGDDTPKRAGRLTLNPLVHIDPVGTLLLPLCLLMLQGQASMLPLLGWAKPVPISPERMHRRHAPRVRLALLAGAAPVANLVLAILAAVGLVLSWKHPSGDVAPIASLASKLLTINVALTVFQLLPIGPLSGFRLLCAALPPRVVPPLERINATYGQFALIALIVFGRDLIGGPMRFVATTLLHMVSRIL